MRIVPKSNYFTFTADKTVVLLKLSSFSFQSGTDIPSFFADAADNRGVSVQPYLIYIKESKQFLVAEDRETLCLSPSATIIDAFDILFKVHYVMNVDYPKSLVFFYDFMDTQVYETAAKVPYPSVVSFVNAIENFEESSSGSSS